MDPLRDGEAERRIADLHCGRPCRQAHGAAGRVGAVARPKRLDLYRRRKAVAKHPARVERHHGGAGHEPEPAIAPLDGRGQRTNLRRHAIEAIVKVEPLEAHAVRRVAKRLPNFLRADARHAARAVQPQLATGRLDDARAAGKGIAVDAGDRHKTALREPGETPLTPNPDVLAADLNREDVADTKAVGCGKGARHVALYAHEAIVRVAQPRPTGLLGQDEHRRIGLVVEFLPFVTGPPVDASPYHGHPEAVRTVNRQRLYTVANVGWQLYANKGRALKSPQPLRASEPDHAVPVAIRALDAVAHRCDRAHVSAAIDLERRVRPACSPDAAIVARGDHG